MANHNNAHREPVDNGDKHAVHRVNKGIHCQWEGRADLIGYCLGDRKPCQGREALVKHHVHRLNILFKEGEVGQNSNKAYRRHGSGKAPVIFLLNDRIREMKSHPRAKEVKGQIGEKSAHPLEDHALALPECAHNEGSRWT